MEFPVSNLADFPDSLNYSLELYDLVNKIGVCRKKRKL